MDSRSISSTSRCSMFDCLTRAMTASISAGLVFGISSPLPILDRSPSHSRGNNYFDRPLPQSAFDWEDFSADVRLFLKGTPPHRRDTKEPLSLDHLLDQFQTVVQLSARQS